MTPARLLQFAPYERIAVLVRCNLGRPKFRARRGQLKKLTVMTVPKAAVYEDYSTSGRENHIGLSSHCRTMKAITKAEAMNRLSYRNFGPGILPSDT
jgi:hypothetical protein